MRQLMQRTYRVLVVATSLAVPMMACAFLTVGCTGFAEQARPTAESDGDGRAVAQRLYESMQIVFRKETAGIDIAIDERLTLISHYEEVAQDRRRRFVGRVVPVGGGVGVRIRAEYQNEASSDDQVIWRDEPRETVEEEASPDELRLARMVERVYHGGEP